MMTRQGICNEDQLWLMGQVKAGHMTIDEAVNWKEMKELELRMEGDECRINGTVDDHKNDPASNERVQNIQDHEKVYNFIVFSQRKFKPVQKRIMQIDFDGKVVALIEQGRISKTFKFSSITSADGQDSKKILINFDDNHSLDVVMETLSDKIKIIRLLHLVVEQNECDVKGIHFDPSQELEKKFTVIKEGHLDKQESYGEVTWIKRLVTVRSGELAYHRIDEDEDSSALNVIRLAPDVITITIVDDAIFTITSWNQTYQFKVAGNSKYYKELRDEWITAIKQACNRDYYKYEAATINVIKKSASVKMEKSSNLMLNGFNRIQKEVEEYRSDLMNMSAEESGVREINSKINSLSRTLSQIRQILIEHRYTSPISLSQSTPEIHRGSITMTSSAMQKSIVNGGKDVRKGMQRAFQTLFSRRNARSIPMAQQIQYEPTSTTTAHHTSPGHRGFPRSRGRRSTMVETDRITSFIDPPLPVVTTSPPSPELPEVAVVVVTTDDHDAETEVIAVVDDDEQEVAEVAEQLPVVQVTPEVVTDPPKLEEISEEETQPTTTNLNGDEMVAATTNQTDDEVATVDDVKIEIEIPLPVPPLPSIPLPPSLPLAPPPPSKQMKKKRETMRVIHVSPVPHEQLSGSLWERVGDVKYLIEHQQLYDDFAIKVKKSKIKEKSPNETTAAVDVPPTKLKNVTYLDQKTAQNLGIFISSFKFRGEKLLRKISTVDENDGGLSSDHVISLSKFCPEPDLKSLYEKHCDNPDVLTKQDLFMMELCSIPKLTIRLDILKHLRELPQEMEIIEPEMELVYNACTDLLNSKLFEEFLTYLLAATNHINSCNIKGESKGLRLSSLQQAFMMRTNDRERNLLTVLIRIIKLRSPHILELPNELSNVPKAKLFSIKGLRAELDVMRKGLHQVRKNSEFLRRKKNQIGAEICKFCEDVEVAVTKQECDLDRMDVRLQQVHQAMHRVIIRFGEVPTMQSQQVFGCVDEFLTNFRSALLSTAT